MASTARIDELKKKFDENPRRYFAPLANEFRKAGDIEQAIVICEEFLPQQPGHMSGHIVYGQALFEAGKLPESRGVFETALGLDPENLIALRHLGDIARDQGDHPAARNWYARVLDADPRNEEIQAVIASLEVPVAAAAEPVEERTSVFAPPPIPAQSPAPEPLREEPELLDLETFGAPEPTPAPAAAAPVDPALADTHPLGVPIIPSGPLYVPSLANTEVIEGFSAHSYEKQPDTESLMPSAPAMGFESTSFSAPEEPVPTVDDLDSTLESGVPSFEAPASPVSSLEGLQGSGGDTYDAPNALPPLDVDDGMVLPPQGDPLAAAMHSSAEASYDEPDTDEFEVPDGMASTSVMDAMSSPTDDASYDDAPMEVPPAVIAAEAELIDAGETPAPPPPPELEMASERAPVAQPTFVTETMAELYLAQGYRDRARDVYIQLSAGNPSDERLRGLVDSLGMEAAGPNVRDFFARLASRRPANRAAAVVPPSADDFAPTAADADIEPPEEVPYSVAEADDSSPEEYASEPYSVEPEAVPLPEMELAPEPEPEPEPFAAAPEEVAPALERAAKMRTPNGSIDALFGNRTPGTSEDSAAAALAQAFGGVTEGPLPTIGRPAHAAAGELSLDSVFRDGPPRAPRTSQSFSFDQFFTGSASSTGNTTGAPRRPSGELAAPGDLPAERSTEDIEQFNSWLQGLKQR